MVIVNHISKSFGSLTALDDLTFTIERGEIVGLLGPNGAGKTTTMRVISGYLTPDAGTVTIGGIPVDRRSAEAQKMIGYLPENNPLYQDMLVADLLALACDLHGIKKDRRVATFDFIVPATTIGEVFYRPIRELSKGYRQRVGIALALLHQPRLIIMDEPTEGLDPNQRTEIRRLIKQLAHDRTIIMSTHVMQEAAAVCSRLLVIAQGKLVADGSPQEVTALARGERTLLFEAEGLGIADAVRTMAGIKHVEVVHETGDRVALKLILDTHAMVQPELSRLARANNWTIWRLSEGEYSLEEVFHSLTKQSV